MNFKAYIHEMLELVKNMYSDAPLDKIKYSIASTGIRDNNTGAILAIEKAPGGVICTILHPNLLPGELEKSVIKLGYIKREADCSSTMYVLKDKEGMPSAIALGNDGKSLRNYEFSKDRKTVLNPLKKILEEISK